VIRIKRIYEPPAPEDGFRLLVMRLWPRGVPGNAVDGWERELGPSRGLLRDWRQRRIPWEEFARRYREEMRAREGLLTSWAQRAARGTLTLLCSCADEARCHRALLRDLLEEALRGSGGGGG